MATVTPSTEAIRLRAFSVGMQGQEQHLDTSSNTLPAYVLFDMQTGRAHVMPRSALHISNPQLEQEFRGLVSQWSEDTLHISNINKAIKHPAYQQIIGMGKAVSSLIVPLLLRELEQNPDHWFWALREITKEDPAQSEDTFDGAVQAWLRWGKQRYLNARP